MLRHALDEHEERRRIGALLQTLDFLTQNHRVQRKLLTSHLQRGPRLVMLCQGCLVD